MNSLVSASRQFLTIKSLFAQEKFNKDKLLIDPRYIEELPLLTKDIVRENGNELRLANAIHGRKTGGSTANQLGFFMIMTA